VTDKLQLHFMRGDVLKVTLYSSCWGAVGCLSRQVSRLLLNQNVLTWNRHWTLSQGRWL